MFVNQRPEKPRRRLRLRSIAYRSSVIPLTTIFLFEFDRRRVYIIYVTRSVDSRSRESSGRNNGVRATGLLRFARGVHYVKSK